jgi:hypothetical protein
VNSRASNVTSEMAEKATQTEIPISPCVSPKPGDCGSGVHVGLIVHDGVGGVARGTRNAMIPDARI